jgi:hypothetical protein
MLPDMDMEKPSGKLELAAGSILNTASGALMLVRSHPTSENFGTSFSGYGAEFRKDGSVATNCFCLQTIE